MLMIDAQITANQVLRAFHRDEPYLFLGSAFTAVGVVAIGLCTIRRRFDALLVWMGIFAGLYGLRLWLQSSMLYLELDGNLLFDRMRSAIRFPDTSSGALFLPGGRVSETRRKGDLGDRGRDLPVDVRGDSRLRTHEVS